MKWLFINKIASKIFVHWDAILAKYLRVQIYNYFSLVLNLMVIFNH